MNDDELERLLRDSFDAQARAAVGDGAAPPPPRFAAPAPTAPRRRRLAAFAPVAAAAVVVAVLALVVALTRSGTGHRPVAGAGSSAARSSSVPASQPTSPASTSRAATSPRRSTPSATAAAVPVHVSLANSDGATYGVGMPVIAYFSRRITDARALQAATRLTVNGRPGSGAWYFETAGAAHAPLEAHFRPPSFWPAHARIHLSLSVRGLAAGPGFAFGNNLALDFRTGAANISTVDDVTHQMTVTRDGRPIMRVPVSLGARNTPTTSGIKVVMEKGASICMTGPGYSECNIKYTQRLTYSGEYLHAAPWNALNIEKGRDTSNGCTNLLPADAARLYVTAQVGDVVRYPNAPGPRLSVAGGYGDWNVPWSTWTTGGLVPTG